MPPKRWATPEETALLESKMAEYITQRADGKLWRFWPALFKVWFDRFSEEARLGFAVVDDDGNELALSEEKEEIVATALEKRMGQLMTWYRYHSKKVNTTPVARLSAEDSLANDLFRKNAPRKRALRPVELFQKRNRAIIDAALDAEGFFDINEAKMAESLPEWSTETDVTRAARIKAAQAERMKLRQRVVDELFSEASEDELRSIGELGEEEARHMAAINKGTKKGLKELKRQEEEDAARDPTPGEYQMAIDESPEVLARVHRALARKTGWYGITIYGGPNPRFAGGLSMKTVCFGRTQAGNDFETAHGTFDESISKHFQAFLKRSFPAEVRRSRALQELEEEPAALPSLDGLFRLPNDPEPPVATSREKPKRIRKTKPKGKKPSKKQRELDAAAPLASADAGAAPADIPMPSPGSLPPSSPSDGSLSPPQSSSAASKAAAARRAGSVDPFADADELDGNLGLGQLFREGMEDDTGGMEDDTGATAWPSGMGPPSSPATAEAAANAERGGLQGATYNQPAVPKSPPIDPRLLNVDPDVGGVAARQLPVLRPAFKGSVAWKNAQVSPSPTTQVLGFNFPAPNGVAGPARLRGLFSRFHTIMDTPTNSLATTNVPIDIRSHGQATSTGPVSPNTPARIARISTMATGASATPPAAPEPSPAPFLIQTRPATKPPGIPNGKAAASTKKSAGGRGRKSGTGDATETAAKESAAKTAAKSGKKKTAAKAKRGTHTAPPADADIFSDTTNLDGVPAAPAVSTVPTPAPPTASPTAPTPASSAAPPPALIYSMTNNNAVYAREARRLEIQQKARDDAAKKERARLYNPDGPSDLVIVPPPPEARAQRVRKRTKNFDGSVVVSPPKKLTRAEQLAKRNQPSEEALLAQTGNKRGAAQAALAATSRPTKKSKK